MLNKVLPEQNNKNLFWKQKTPIDNLYGRIKRMLDYLTKGKKTGKFCSEIRHNSTHDKYIPGWANQELINSNKL